MLELQSVTKIFNRGQPNEMIALRDVSLRFARNTIIAIIGPSGSGKTTMLTLTGCLARPTSGRVSLNGEVISGLPEQFTTALRRRTFGFSFQRFNLIQGLSALENVMLPAFPLAAAHADLTRQAMTLLEQFGVASSAGTPVQLLSGGEMQRVAMARALINDPAIILADEPTANLDSRLGKQFLTMLGDLKACGKTVILTSHDPRIYGAAIIDRIIRMADGRVLDGAS